MAHYQELLDGELLAPASTLVGGVRAKRGVDPGTVQPLIGVYLLMLKGKVVYFGSSLHMPNRVAQHSTNGRPFDQVSFEEFCAADRWCVTSTPNKFVTAN